MADPRIMSEGRLDPAIHFFPKALLAKKMDPGASPRATTLTATTQFLTISGADGRHSSPERWPSG
jgi:hypothetical protein